MKASLHNNPLFTLIWIIGSLGIVLVSRGAWVYVLSFCLAFAEKTGCVFCLDWPWLWLLLECERGLMLFVFV